MQGGPCLKRAHLQGMSPDEESDENRDGYSRASDGKVNEGTKRHVVLEERRGRQRADFPS